VSHSTWCRFIVGLVAATLALWPLGAAAQQAGTGMLAVLSPDVSVTWGIAMGAQRDPGNSVMPTRSLDRAQLEGVELEYEVRGAGEPVVLVHNGPLIDGFKPLLEHPAIVERYRVVHYHRAGYAGSSRLAGPLTFAEEAATTRALLRHLGIERAHVVGHSSSGSMVLQLALDAPDAVQSLALLEPALLAVPAPPEVLQAVELYRAGDKAKAFDTFLLGTCGPDYRPALEQAVPGAFDQAVADADTFFGQELPALRQWSFRPDDARRVKQPALVVRGERSGPIHHQRWDLLMAWLPNAEPFVLPGATHLLHLENPDGMAEALAAFFARHPLTPRD
jgi:pimeloyl-ACP methyl ester carboxylesterase